ncbi:unnamed protein product [Triticum aestivum]|uniref:FLZ-type domain-containing protein n=4 Tax=Triticum aestivum TaxID=4565 RepID=A0A7H4LMT1_WHEAT|nr:unnamed protein product [Triticum aestivum]
MIMSHELSSCVSSFVCTHHIYPSLPLRFTQLARAPLPLPLPPSPHCESNNQAHHQAMLCSALLETRLHTPTMGASVPCSFFFDDEPLGEPGMPALDACALCAKPLARDSDIFMYRGDTPFCSEECRHEQMQLDAICSRQAARRQLRLSSGSEARRWHQDSGKVSVAS